MKVNRLEKRLSRFTKSEDAFQSLLAKNPIIDIPLNLLEISNVTEERRLTLTIVSSPTCQPCARTHFLVENFINQFDKQISVIYRFSVNARKRESEEYQMLTHLFSILQSEGKTMSNRALNDWFQSGRFDIEKWKLRFPVKSIIDYVEIEDLIKKHSEWCFSTNIQKTPTIFINGRQMPDAFIPEDLPFQFRRLLNDITQPEPVS